MSSSQAAPRRHTRQREAIVRVIQASRGPLAVNDILERAQREHDGLGIATVYRTLKLLLEDGTVRQVILPSGETRYEMSGLGHHHHFQCRRCGEVVDLDVCPVAVLTGTTLAGGYTVEGHELTLYGVCPSCQE